MFILVENFLVVFGLLLRENVCVGGGEGGGGECIYVRVFV